MTEREILERQERTGNREFFLVLVGSFLHAYGAGAFALCRVTGYRVVRKRRKWGEVLTAGFPAGRLDLVRQRLRDAGCEVEQVDRTTHVFRGADGTPDDRLVSEPQPKPEPAAAARPSVADGAAGGLRWLADAVGGFNLSMSTPLDAMLLIGTLQQRLKEEDKEDNAWTVPAAAPPETAAAATGIACESPAGHGLRERAVSF